MIIHFKWAERDQLNLSDDQLQKHFNPQRIKLDSDCFIKTDESGNIQENCFYDLNLEVGDAWGTGKTVSNALLKKVGQEIKSQSANPIKHYCWVSGKDETSIETFSANDYDIAKISYQLSITLTDALSAPALPDGFKFQHQHDTRALFDAHHTAFRENWQSYDHKITYEEWLERYVEGHETSLWVVILSGEQIAGFSLNQKLNNEIAIIDSIGVLPDFRRQGLGEIVLRQSFYQLQQHGFQKAVLSVDTQNPNEAVRLYQKAGMSIDVNIINYHKVIG